MLLLGFAAGISYASLKSNSKKELTKISVPTQMGINQNNAIALFPGNNTISQLDSENLEHNTNYVNFYNTTVTNEVFYSKCRDPIIPFNTS